MKTKTVIIIVVVILLLTAGVWIWAAKKPLDTKEPPTGSPEAKKAAEAANTVKMPLKQGSRGNLVKAVQLALNAKVNANLKTDGILGPKTTAALKAAGYETTIYWKQWSEITGSSLIVGGKLVNQEKTTADNPWLKTIPASYPNYFM